MHGKENFEFIEEIDEVIDDNILMAYDIAVFYNTYDIYSEIETK